MIKHQLIHLLVILAAVTGEETLISLSDTHKLQIIGIKELLTNLDGIYPTCNMVLFSEMVDYDTADERCKSFDLGTGFTLGGNLATVNDEDKNTDLKLLLDMAYPDSTGKWDDDAWVWAGLRKVKNNSERNADSEYDVDDWAWSDGSTPEGFEKWMKGMPDQRTTTKNGVTYLQNQMRINHAGKWDDTFTYKTHPYACDYQGKYIMSATEKSWSDAKTTCENAGLIMAKVRDDSEVEEIKTAAEYFLGPVDESLRVFDSLNWIWIGGNDGDEEGTWQWNDGDAIEWFDEMPWRDPNPDNSRRLDRGRISQNYLSISKWGEFDDSFDSKKRTRAFACQCPGT